jgi:hypothetical protein
MQKCTWLWSENLHVQVGVFLTSFGGVMLTNTPHTWIFHFVNSVDEVTVVFCHPVGKYIMYSNKYRWRQAWICIDLETQRSTCCLNRLEQKTQIVQHNPNTTFLSFSKLHNTDLLNLTTLWLEMNWQLHKQVGKNKQMHGWICCVEQGSKNHITHFRPGRKFPIHIYIYVYIFNALDWKHKLMKSSSWTTDW